MATATSTNPDLQALVDIGSNGIRFSITSVAPATARLLPALYVDRASISLYTDQNRGATKTPISAATTTAVTRALARFKHTCATFAVPPDAVRVVATEATREASNAADFRRAIRDATGWDVQVLPKEVEGEVGAYGVASSLADVQGVVMDLGGGSTQLSWVLSPAGSGEVQICPRPISLPYGAAALTKRLDDAGADSAKVKAIETEVSQALQDAVAKLALPPALQHRRDGLPLFLSGGGFRGFGYLLLAQSPIQPYPIPIINGFCVPSAHFRTLAGDAPQLADAAAVAATFRISRRRAAQLPAVAFLVRTLTAALATGPVTFCQGGVREGVLYRSQPAAMRAASPLRVATARFAPASASAFAQLLERALPPVARQAPRALVPAVANMLCFARECVGESRATVGLHCTTTGVLAGVHGLSHAERAALGLALCARWGGDVHDTTLRTRLEEVVGDEMAYWCRYIGAVAAVLGAVYPAGCVDEERIALRALSRGKNMEGVGVMVRLRKADVVTDDGGVRAVLDEIEQVGKKKNCRLGYRRKVEVFVRFDLGLEEPADGEAMEPETVLTNEAEEKGKKQKDKKDKDDSPTEGKKDKEQKKKKKQKDAPPRGWTPLAMLGAWLGDW